MINQYLDQFARWTRGSESKRERSRAELEAHLRAAEESGELDETMRRMGTPRDAARSFAEGMELVPAHLGRRIAAALIDAVIAAALVVATMGFGTWAYGQGNDSASYLPLKILVVLIAIPAFAYWPIGLTVAEWRYRRTPGKALMGLEVASEDGTAPGFWQVVVRRLTLVFSGPLQIIDWGYALFNEKRQRALDRLAGTMVVPAEADPAPAGASVSPTAQPS
jgi:uncharacterized RDD family membrane protein YckC